MVIEDRRQSLGRFVRAHRERLVPPPDFGRRRTPGLRREELAARAGISATWCAWIEQGRDVQASPQALARLAEALELSAAERAYLFELADRLDPARPAAPTEAEVPASIAALLAVLPGPAYGLDGLWNACGWNEAAAALFEGWLAPGAEPNLLRYVFLDPAARRLLPDWEERARRILAEFRVDFARGRGDPRLQALVDGLAAESPFFAAAWADQAVAAREGGRRAFNHPAFGPIVFDQHSFAPTDAPDHKLAVLLPVA